MKPHKGTIENWWKHTNGVEDHGLGYLIRGTCVDHPNFGTSRTFHTSYVVKHDGNEVETRNSRYTLGKPYVENRTPEEIEKIRKKAQEAARKLLAMGAI